MANAERPLCRCGLPKILGGRTVRYWTCPPCNRASLRARRGGGKPANPVDVTGARERLARYLDAHWSEALPRLVELMGRSAAFGVPPQSRPGEVSRDAG